MVTKTFSLVYDRTLILPIIRVATLMNLLKLLLGFCDSTDDILTISSFLEFIA